MSAPYNNEANARLIATAAELLDALAECVAWHDLDAHRTAPVNASESEVGRRMIAAARAAIAKATGAPHKTTPTKVTVEVTGGVAAVTSCPAGVQVEIIDHDNQDNGGFPVQPSTFTVQPSAQ
jgi:hypothetical protein